MDWVDRIGRRIRLRDLHILMAVSECGSMSKAAAQLSISHPVVSKTISDLEQTLGVRLFDRGPQGVEPTAYGTVLLDCGVTVFDEMRQGLTRIELLTKPDTGELRIGCPDVEIAGIIPSVVETFLKVYPRVRLQVVHANTSMMHFDELRSRSVDLVIGRVPSGLAEDDLDVANLFTESLVAVAGRDSPWSRRRRLSLVELVDEPWVLPPNDSVRGPLIANIFRANGMQQPQPSVATLSLQLTTTLIATGRFFGFVPRSVAGAKGARSQLCILPLRIPEHQITVDVITIKKRTLSPLVESFIECARKCVTTN